MEADSSGLTSGNKKHNHVFITLLFLFIYTSLFNSGQAQQFFKLDPPRKNITIPFSFHRNLIIVPIYLNEQGPYNFLLDTGVGIGLITNPNLLDSLNLKKGAEVRITGAGNELPELKAFQVPNVKVKLKGLKADALTFTILTEDIFNLSTYIGLPISGILGYQFFNSFVVRVNFLESTLTLYPPENYKYRKSDGIAVPFQLEDLKPYIYALTTIENDKKLSIKLILDTGAGHALSLDQNSNSVIQIPKRSIRTQLGTGLTGTINGSIGRIQSFQLNKFVFKDILSSFPDYADVGAKVNVGRNGNLGNEILKRFHLIIDYSRSRIILKPNSFYRQSFEHDMSGIEIVASGEVYNRFFIYKVEPNSPAAEADILAGDEILYINAADASKLSISNIDKLFRLRDGQKLLIILRRDEETIYRILTLKRRI